jgi:hypothetical protein
MLPEAPSQICNSLLEKKMLVGAVGIALGVSRKPANGVAQDVILIYPAFS